MERRPRPVEYDVALRVQFRGDRGVPFQSQSVKWDSPEVLKHLVSLFGCGEASGGRRLLAVIVSEQGLVAEFEP